MANTSIFTREPEGSGSHISQVKKFNELYRTGIAQDDANGVVLNEAVSMHINEARLPDTTQEDDDDDPGVSILLQQKMEKLEESRKNFMRYLSPEQRETISRASNTTESVLSLVDSATFDWCKRSESGSAFARALKKRFHQACKSMDQHSALFSILPKESEYVSVFYGALNSVVAASVMHQAMAVGLPRIVDELNAIVRVVATKFELYPKARQQMKRVVMELYTRIFDLFADLMKWYSKNNHHWKIMKKDCYNDFEHALQDIRNWMNLVDKGALSNLVLELRDAHEEDRYSRECEHKAQAHFREEMRRVAEEYAGMQKNYALQQAAQQAQLERLGSAAYQDKFANLLMSKFFHSFEQMGTNQFHTLLSMASTIPQENGRLSGPSNGGVSQIVDTARIQATQTLAAVKASQTQDVSESPMGPSFHSINRQTRDDIQRYTRRLDNWFQEGHVHPVHLSNSPVARSILHESIASRLMRWTNGTTSQFLCIQLPFDATRESLGSKIASYVVSTACQVDHPIVSYFCTLPLQEEIPQGRTPQTVALCAMMACLIRQLVAMLPDVLPESPTAILDEERISNLDGTLLTWRHMLDIFADLLSFMPHGVLFVLHGMQCLDSEHTTDPMWKMLDLLRARLQVRPSTAMQAAKVLLVIEGSSRAIVPWLQHGEHAIFNGDRRSGRQLNIS